MESAIEHSKATGENYFLNSIEKYIDHIIDTFGREYGKKRGYPGHQEIELALIKAYEYTNKKKYLKLATYFIEERGKSDTNHKHYFINENEILKKNSQKLDYSKLPSNLRDFVDFYLAKDESVFKDLEYWQAHKEPIKQNTAEGHSVRALYMFTAMADLARINNNKDLLKTCKLLWRNIVDKRMYIHSGVGSAHIGERFSFDYDLPNETAYAETCASIALANWAHRMFHMEPNSEYIDVLERTIYNGILSGLNLNGDRFFYSNRLAALPKEIEANHHGSNLERQPWFDVACCPTNIVRFLPSIPGFIYSKNKTSVSINLYIQSKVVVDFYGHKVTINQKNSQPWDDKCSIEVDNESKENINLFLRVPHWSKKIKVKLNNKIQRLKVSKGYCSLTIPMNSMSKLDIDLGMDINLVDANPNVRQNFGKQAKWTYYSSSELNKLKKWLIITLADINLNLDQDYELTVSENNFLIRKFPTFGTKGSKGNVSKFN